MVHDGLRLLLASTNDIVVMGDADNGHRALREIQRLQPNIVLMDIAMPLLTGLEATRQVVREMPFVKVLILSSYSDDHHVQQALEAGVGLIDETVRLQRPVGSNSGGAQKQRLFLSGNRRAESLSTSSTAA